MRYVGVRHDFIKGRLHKFLRLSSLVKKYLQLRERGKELPFILYRYGYERNKVQHAYLLVPQSSVLSFEQGIQRSYDQIPPKLQRKILEEGISSGDEQTLRGLTEMEADLRKDQDERRGGFKLFLEGYNLITAKADPRNALKLGLGSRVEVSRQGKFSSGTVMEIRNDFYQVLFDEGSKEWLPLAEVGFREIEDEDPSKANLPGELLPPEESEDEDEQEESPIAKHARNGCLTDAKISPVGKKRKAIAFANDSSDSGESPKRPRVADPGSKESLSRYLKHSHRIAKNGSICPKTPAEPLPDGTYKAPRGRPPSGFFFDKRSGQYVPTAKVIQRLANGEALGGSFSGEAQG